MAENKFRVYFCPITHHDLGYTHTIDVLLDTYCGYYDDVLDFCDKTDGYPENAKYRYTVEQFWSLDYYLSHTSDANRERVKRRVREGRIELPAFYANIIDTIAGDEELIRMMYPSFAFAEECGVKIRRAALTDIPGMSGGIADILSAAGVKYLFAGFPKYFEWKDACGRVPDMKHTFWDEKFGRPAAFNWMSKSGGSVLTWYHSGYGWFGNEKNVLVEINSISEVRENLPGFVEELQSGGYKYNVMRYIYHGSDNQQPDMNISDIAREWNENYSDSGIEIIVGTDSMFFEELERQCGGCPSFCGEIPHTDYAVLSLTEAGHTAANKYAKNIADIAERTGARTLTDVYMDAVMYDEHCFGMSFPCGPENEYNRNIKNSYALKAMYRAAGALNEAAEALPAEKDGKNISFISAAGTETNGIAQFLTTELEPGSYKLSRGGKVYKGQVDKIADPLLPMRGLNDCYSANICSGGVCRAVFETGMMLPGEVGSFSAEKAAYAYDDPVLSLNGDLVLTDSSGNRLTHGYGFGEVISRNCSDGTLFRQEKAIPEKISSGPVCDIYVTKTRAYGAPEIITEYKLFKDRPRADVSVRIVFDRTPAKEIFMAFPFDVKGAEYTYHGTNYAGRAFDENVGGVNTNHYSTGKWVKADNGKMSAVLSTVEGGTVFFGGLNTTEVSQAHHMVNPPHFEDEFVRYEDSDSGNMFVMLAYNNCRTNFAMAQSGEAIYGFSVTVGRDINEIQTSEEFVYSPVYAGKGKTEKEGISLPGNVMMQHSKPAENGRGRIYRLRETAGAGAEFTLGKEAVLCDILENDVKILQDGTVRIRPYELVCIRITD